MPVDFATQAGHFNGADLQILGKTLSADSRSKVLSQTIPLVATAAGTTRALFIVPFDGLITSERFTFVDALTANDTNFVSLRTINKTQADSAVIAATDANTTKATGGTGLTAYGVRTAVLATAAGVAVTKLDVLEVQIIATGTLANTLTNGRVQINLLVAT